MVINVSRSDHEGDFLVVHYAKKQHKSFNEENLCLTVIKTYLKSLLFSLPCKKEELLICYTWQLQNVLPNHNRLLVRLTEPLGLLMKTKWYSTRVQIFCCCCCCPSRLTARAISRWVERLTAEREVVGSVPGDGSILKVLKKLRNEVTTFALQTATMTT